MLIDFRSRQVPSKSCSKRSSTANQTNAQFEQIEQAEQTEAYELALQILSSLSLMRVNSTMRSLPLWREAMAWLKACFT